MQGSTLPFSVKLTGELLELMAQAAMAGGKEIRNRYRRSRRPVHEPTRQPGSETPMWNVLVEALREELKPHGTQARLARYLGLPRQRIHDFLKGGRRMPDAETTLRLVHWLSERSAGRDPSL